jgi:hypothetical protein
MFVEGIRQYHQYTQNQSVLAWLFGSIVGRILEAVSVMVCAFCMCRVRREPATSVAFGRAFALVLALTVVIVPMFAPYNQVLLAPAIFVLLRREISRNRKLPAIQTASAVAGILLVWPWIAAVGLSLAYIWLTPELRQHLWPMPFYSNFMVPVFIFGLVLVDAWANDAHRLPDRATAE